MHAPPSRGPASLPLSLPSASSLGGVGACAAAGLLAAFGPVFARLAALVRAPGWVAALAGRTMDVTFLTQPEPPPPGSAGEFSGRAGSSASAGVEPATLVTALAAVWLLRGLCLCGVVLCNVGMWPLHLRGMQRLSSLAATVVNSTTNILFSGLLGALFLGETISTRWLCGAACMCFGVVLLSLAAFPTPEEDHANTRKKEN